MDQAELRQWEARCIQEEPPRCAAACPLHVDARAVCGHLAAGRPGAVDEAWAVLCRTLPLPGVLARICDAPCRPACLRSERGGGLAMGELERFCAGHATRTPRLVRLPDRGKTVAVCGAGLAGLAAAWDLARKGFTVTLFTHAPVRVLLDRFPDRLPPQALDEALDGLSRLGVTLAPAPEVDRAAAEAALRVFAAVILDPEQCPYESLGLGTSDPATLATNLPGLFAAPRPDTDSPVALAALGRRAANSVERHVQGASLAAGREREGVFASRLFTNISQVVDLAPVPAPSAGYGPDQARAEAGRCLNCQCLECVRHCAYLEHYGSYPKVYARRVFNNEAIVMGSRQANEFINSCMLCGLCEEVCPKDFAVADLCLTARQGMVARGRMPPSAHDFALRDMASANGERCALARPAPGQEASPVALFPGCQLAASDPGAVQRAYAHLRAALPGGTGLLLRCCGAPARWAGQTEAAERAAAGLRADWEGLGRPHLAAACPSCVLGLKAELPEARVSSLWEVLAEAGLPADVAAPGRTLAVHDPCASRRDPAQRRALRGLLDRLDVAWTEPERSGDLTECCGFGGLLVHANPSLGAEVARLRAQAATEDFVTTCAMCRDLLARAGKRSLHLLDLLTPGPDPDPAARPAPGHSERRENRARLKEALMREVWNEAAPGPEPWDRVAVAFTPEAAARLEERRILRSDVQKALLAMERSGRFLANTATGRRLAAHRPMAVTYWVECEPDGAGGYLVHNAWCHRMQVREGA
jgi:Fe-S oxidoreductase